MRNTKTCGEAIVALLEQYDVDTVFGIPGVHTLELYRGLVGSRIRHILPRHEQGAGFMADGYARASGKPGVCFLITGPGLTNASTAIAQAYSDSIPMLVISSVNQSNLLGKGRGELHEMPDQQKMMSAFTAFSARADTPDHFPALLAKAFDVFDSKRPRPVHIEVPIDIFEKPVDEEWVPMPRAEKPIADAADIKQAIDELQQAKAPMIIVGGGAIGGDVPLLSLAEKLSAPVVTSVAGSGVFPSSHPLSLGPILVAPSAHELITKSDVVLVVGTELASTETWGIPFKFSGKMIRVDIDETQFTNSYAATLNIQGDGPVVLAAIDEGVSKSNDNGYVAARATDVKKALAAFDASLGPEENIRRKVFEKVVNAAPEDALIACDMTQIGYTGHSVFRPETPGRMLFPNGYGTLGYGLPAGLGAKLGAPHKSVLVFVGDGGLLYTMQEMATAVDEHLPIVVILWNNDLLQQIHEGFVDHGIEPIAVSPKNPDFQMLGKSFGWSVSRCDKISMLAALTEKSLAQSEATGIPSMIEVMAKEL